MDEKRARRERHPSSEEILSSLRREGIGNLDELAKRVDEHGEAGIWAIWVKQKVVIFDSEKVDPAK